MYQIGVDVGSTFTKYCILDMSKVGIEKLELFSERTPIHQREHFCKKIIQFRERYGNCSVVTCGYGKKNIENYKTISELTALAAGMGDQNPDIQIILDIGGQDTKIVCQDKGKLKTFFVNEKCAAGCGLFLGHVLNLLQMNFEDIDLSAENQPKIQLSSVCAVFAQSEIVELIADGIPNMTIVYAVLRQILVQAKALLGKVDCKEIALSGGLTKIPGIRGVAEQIFDKKVIIPKNAFYLSAIGCALQGCVEE